MEQQRQELQEEKQQIMEIRQSIEQQNYNLEIRENRLVELEPLIPSVKQLQGYGVTFDLILPYIETIHEKAEKNIDLKTAAYNLVQDLREYRQLGSLNKTLQQMTQQLSALNAVTVQKQNAIVMLINLQNAGIMEKEIAELINISRMAKQYDVGTSQGNGGSHNNITGNYNGSKPYKLDDKLNL